MILKCDLCRQEVKREVQGVLYKSKPYIEYSDVLKQWGPCWDEEDGFWLDPAHDILIRVGINEEEMLRAQQQGKKLKVVMCLDCIPDKNTY